jgi:hypothetical protein
MRNELVVALCFMALLIGLTSAQNETTIVNLMTTTDIAAHPTQDQINSSLSNLMQLYGAIQPFGVKGTIFVTGDMANLDTRMILARTASDGFEIGISGNNSDEKLSSKSYAEQKNLLANILNFAGACYVCGQNKMIVKGFMPQSFDQNQDTYKALDDIGIQYDAGFQSGLLYTPGHENDVWPYSVQGHNFYAVPVSTYDLSGKKVVLQDRYFKDNGLSASQWYDALAGKFDQIQGKDEPLVISLTTSVSSSGDYLDALKRFKAYAISKGARFVTTSQLVDMAKTGIRDVSALAPEANASANCPTCGQASNEAKITVYSNNATNTTQSATA